MQVLIFPCPRERAAAEALEPSELATNINLTYDLLRMVPDLYEGYEQWIAYYGMCCAKVLRDKGFQAPDVSGLMPFKPDNSIRPRWHEKFIKQHRGYLVFLGWIRYFNERGATGTVLREYQLQSPMELAKQANSPQDLASRFTTLDSFCNDSGFPEAKRPYASFEDLPAAYPLHP